MVTAVSTTNAAYNSSIADQSIHKPTQAPSQSSVPQDTVTLSAASQKAAASVDVDHDGDSH